LLSRGNDYTATNGTTITLTTATVAGDIIEVFANQTIPLTDTYSQTVSDGRFIKNTLTTTTGDIIYASAANTPARLGIGSTDQVLKVSGGIPAWGAAPAATFVGVNVSKSADQTLTTNVQTTITFDVEQFDTDNFHSNTTNNSRLTVPSGKAGKYLVVGTWYWTNATTGWRGAVIYKNGNEFLQGTFTLASGDALQYNVVGIVDLAVGDYIEMAASQSSGGNLNLVGTLGQRRTNLGMFLIGA
jgi:hypothetical protein